MRLTALAILLGTLLCLGNHLGVIAGIAAPPPGYEPAYYIRNLDVPQFVTWMELAKTHWLLPDEHAPWQTEPGLFQPMYALAAHTGLPTIVSYYGLQLLMYWLAAYALIVAMQTFLKTRRAMLYGALAVLGAMPLLLLGWAAAKALGLPAAVQSALAYGVVQYTYDTADGLVRGGLSNSFLLTFGTAMTLFAFVNLARFVTTSQRRYYYWLLLCVFLDGLFHPFEIFAIAAAAVWPLWKAKRMKECLGLFAVAGAGMLPYVIQTLRCAWVGDIAQLGNWKMGSLAWILLVYGLPAILICWLMAIRFRVDTAEDGILQSWFLCAAVLPWIPGVPSGMHTFDGYAYVVGFLLVRKAQSDPLLSQIAVQKPRALRFALAGWGLVSALVLVTVYTQLWKDGKSAHPDFLSAVAPQQEVAMLAWMKANLPRDRLVLAPEAMAPWVAAIPMPSVGSHDLFSFTYQAQRNLASRFYQGHPERSELIDGFGVSYVIAPVGAPIVLEHSRLLHQESSLRLYEVPGEQMKPYPGIAHLAGIPAPNGFRQWMFRVFGKLQKSA
ncbi:MAG TPA: hypothetical protein VK686_13090 [Bryobacteraceae bacterium]|nr:hypothetical protein [Bryobacteraceae bacterium]